MSPCGVSPFLLVVNILLLIVEPYGCLSSTADVRITYLPQVLGLPTMTNSFSTSTQTIRIGLFQATSLFSWAKFHIPCNWIYKRDALQNI